MENIYRKYNHLSHSDNSTNSCYRLEELILNNGYFRINCCFFWYMYKGLIL